jgi:hypothetical protein
MGWLGCPAANSGAVTAPHDIRGRNTTSSKPVSGGLHRPPAPKKGGGVRIASQPALRRFLADRYVRKASHLRVCQCGFPASRGLKTEAYITQQMQCQQPAGQLRGITCISQCSVRTHIRSRVGEFVRWGDLTKQMRCDHRERRRNSWDRNSPFC